MKYLSVCSGIEAASVAWRQLGWEAVGFSEIEPFPCAVLAHHFKNVQNLGDITKYKEWDNVGEFDLLVGGTPCQSFSVAGKRGGLTDIRGQLMYSYLGILERYKPRWCVWENVPGVLSSNNGFDFAEFLSGLEKCGYGWAYRVLDAQYFGVPQRRRRVFVIGYRGDYRIAAKVLFEPESLRGNITSCRKKGKEIAKNIVASTQKNDSKLDNYIFYENNPTDARIKQMHSVCQTVTARFGSGGGNVPFVQCLMDQGGSFMSVETEITGTLRAQTHGHTPIIFYSANAYGCFIAEQSSKARSIDYSNSVSPTLKSSASQPPVLHKQNIVRRFTPVECERLQGFQDNWTLIPYRGKHAKLCPDSHRYKAIGNSMAVPVMRWIGERIEKNDNNNQLCSMLSTR